MLAQGGNKMRPDWTVQVYSVPIACKPIRDIASQFGFRTIVQSGTELKIHLYSNYLHSQSGGSKEFFIFLKLNYHHLEEVCCTLAP